MLQSSISNFQPSQVFVSDFSLGISSSIRSRLLSSSGRDNVGLATKHRSHPRDARVAGGVSGPATAGSAGSAGSASASAKGLAGFSEAGLQIDDLNFISYNKLYIILYIYISYLSYIIHIYIYMYIGNSNICLKGCHHLRSSICRMHRYF